MNLKDTLNWPNLIKSLRDIGEPLDVPECLREVAKCKMYCRADAKAYRDARAAIRHKKEMDNDSDLYPIIKQYLLTLETKYGRHSIYFQSLLDMVAIVTLSDKKVKDKTKGTIPPAFDDSKRSALSFQDNETDEDQLRGRRLRESFFSWLKDTNDPTIQYLKDNMPISKEERDKPGYYRYSLLRNGSSCGITFGTTPLMDIEGQLFQVEGLPTGYDFPDLARYFGILNGSNSDKYYYLTINDNFQGCCGFHTVIADKDGKIREVYKFIPQVSCIGKAIADRWDSVMRACPGIYTYTQRDLVDRILDCNWNQTKLIISLDMEKFSDTIVRAFLMETLSYLGIPDYVLEDLDKLYSVEIWDLVENKKLGSHSVVLQGEYSVFMTMSILNLCIQRYIVSHFNKTVIFNQSYLCSTTFYNGVLGDDTIMIFDKGDYNMIYEFCRNIYGAFGMKISSEKSDHIEMGVGQSDFAKIHFDKDGIMGKLNPRNIENQNCDGIIQDILDLPISTSRKGRLLDSLLGYEAAESILSLSSINGGPSDHPLTEEDINYFINNCARVNMVIKESKVQEEGLLRAISNECINQGFRLHQTILSEFLGNLPMDWNERTDDQKDEEVIVSVLSADRIGSNLNRDILLKALGKTPSEIKEQWDLYKTSKSYNIDVEIWKEIHKFDSFVAKRKMGKQGRFSSVFQTCIDHSRYLMEKVIPLNTIAQITDIRSMQDYYEKERAYKEDMRAELMKCSGITWYKRTHGFTDCVWVNIKTDKGELTYRLHEAGSGSYNPTRPFLYPTLYESWLRPWLKKKKIDLTFSEFYNLVQDSWVNNGHS